jgi:hypothetical protein
LVLVYATEAEGLFPATVVPEELDRISSTPPRSRKRSRIPAMADASIGRSVMQGAQGFGRHALAVVFDARANLRAVHRDAYFNLGSAGMHSVTGIAEVLTGDSPRKYNAEIHRKYLSEDGLLDPRGGTGVRGAGRHHNPVQAELGDYLGYASGG